MNPINQRSNLPRRTVLLPNAILALLLSCGFAALSASAQERVTGIVTNAATGRALEGATVTIQGTSLKSITDEQGVYRFPDLPSGNVILSVAYTGLDTKTVPVAVTKGSANRNDVGLTSEIYKLGQFVVAGEREGNAQAITLQRQSNGIKTSSPPMPSATSPATRRNCWCGCRASKVKLRTVTCASFASAA